MPHLKRLAVDTQTGMITCYVLAAVAAFFSAFGPTPIGVAVAFVGAVGGTAFLIPYAMCKVLVAYREDMDGEE